MCLFSLSLYTYTYSHRNSRPGIRRKNGGAGATVRIGDDDSHNLQEYTYKKITPCDVCSQVLRGEFRVQR